ncbi:arginine ABC transporter substrate-binding protein [Legionella donaldsonii]|uniref:Arginine ABC transporter substrate-binding protein n=1 Tax=Legionella donaldsonii TaxID=45060 RepID=A0A378IZF5_9GAMM|nr:transporter substrate-binding domain-containing protein [Legionella donaldsonii]STX40629.1 arginine ABC transporter substrate-binding protein [Legionella donaldsonii]
MAKACLRVVVTLFFCLSCHVNATVKIGTPIYDPPFVVNNPAYPIGGFDIQLMNTICARLHWQCQYIGMRYYELLSALQANKVDFVLGAIIITPYSQSHYLFSIPYMPSSAVFVTLKQAPFRHAKELAGKKVGCLKGKEYFNYLEQNFVDQLIVVPFEEPSNLIQALNSNTIDAVFMNTYTAMFFMHQYPTRVRALPEQFSLGDGIAIATTMDNREQIEQIDTVLEQILNDGTFVRMYNYDFEFFIPQ